MKSLIRIFSTICILAAISGSAMAAEIIQIEALDGECKKLEIAGKDMAKSCFTTITQTYKDDGFNFFTFILKPDDPKNKVYNTINVCGFDGEKP